MQHDHTGRVAHDGHLEALGEHGGAQRPDLGLDRGYSGDFAFFRGRPRDEEHLLARGDRADDSGTPSSVAAPLGLAGPSG